MTQVLFPPEDVFSDYLIMYGFFQTQIWWTTWNNSSDTGLNFLAMRPWPFSFGWCTKKLELKALWNQLYKEVSHRDHNHYFILNNIKVKYKEK